MTGPDGEPAEEVGGEAPERRYPSTLGGLLYLVVLGVAIAGLLVAALGDWRLGVRMLAASMIFAAVSRLLVPPAQAGMLEVRHRAVDISLLTGVALVLLVLTSTIPA